MSDHIPAAALLKAAEDTRVWWWTSSSHDSGKPYTDQHRIDTARAMLEDAIEVVREAETASTRAQEPSPHPEQ